jgi:hypothetical protein
MMQRKNPNEIPDTISFDYLFNLIVPHQMADGSIDFRGRCVCEDCLRERKDNLNKLVPNIKAVQVEQAKAECPQRLCKSIPETVWEEIEKEHKKETKADPTEISDYVATTVENQHVLTPSADQFVVVFSNGVAQILSADEVGGMIMVEEFSEDDDSDLGEEESDESQ